MSHEDSEPPTTERHRDAIPAVEREFLDKLAASPDDDAIRLVYADWLEEHGQPRRAEFLRIQCKLVTARGRTLTRLEERAHALAPTSDAWWREITSRPRIEKCRIRPTIYCPKRWSRLLPTAKPTERTCPTCERTIYFCSDMVDVVGSGMRGDWVAFDASLLRSEALDGYYAGEAEEREENELIAQMEAEGELDV